MKAIPHSGRLLALLLAQVFCSFTNAAMGAEPIYGTWTGPAYERAASIVCMSHLKEIAGASVRFSSEGNQSGPTRLEDLTNYLTSPQVLTCPANQAHPAPLTFANFSSPAQDYNLEPPTDPTDNGILARCRIHHNYVTKNGDAFQGTHMAPEWPKVQFPYDFFYAQSNESVTLRVVLQSSLPTQLQWQTLPLSNLTFHTFDPLERTWQNRTRPRFGDSTSIAGATNTTFTIQLDGTNNSPIYQVKASNAMGTSLSQRIRVQVIPDVGLTNRPAFQSLQCRIRLHTIGTLLWQWAARHEEQLPPSLTHLFHNPDLEFASPPESLFCPSDPQSVPDSWDAVDANTLTYELFPADLYQSESVLVRCKVHGYLCLADGQVRTNLATPTIEEQPKSTKVANYDMPYLYVQASGKPPLTYQWSFNGVPLLDQTNSYLNVEQPITTGFYSVRVSNALGVVTSTNAKVTVVPEAEVAKLALKMLPASPSGGSPLPLIKVYTEQRTFILQQSANLTNWVNITNAVSPDIYIDLPIPSGHGAPAFFRAISVSP